MQAVILAAGQSSRFYPFNSRHKSLLTLYGKTILEHTLSSVKAAGISDVIIVEDKKKDISKKIGDGQALGLTITYVVQEDAAGQGDALLAAAPHIQGIFFLLHGHRIDFSEFARDLEAKQTRKNDIVLLARYEENVRKYGVLKFHKGKIIDIVEKPNVGDEPSQLRLIGIYLLHKNFLTSLKKISSEHYSLEKALGEYARAGQVQVVVTKKTSLSLKYSWEILKIKNVLLENFSFSIDPTATIAKSAEIIGDVFIGKNSVILEGACIKGPCYIGENVFVGNNVLLRNGVVLENDSKVGAYTEVKNSVLGSASSIHSGFVGDSVIGEHVKIGAFFCSANVRLDRKQIPVAVHDTVINSNARDLGTCIGENVRIGTRVTTMPGVLIGAEATIGPSTTVMKNVASNTLFYTKFEEIVEKKEKNKNEDIVKKDKFVLFDIDYTLFDTRVFKKSNLEDFSIYEEVLDTLVTLSKSAKLGIFSEGGNEFQRSKLHRTDILKHFRQENVHIVPKKDDTVAEVMSRYKNNIVFLVDDKLSLLHLAKQLFPEIHTIWVKRGEYAENQKPIQGFIADYEVKNLQEIIPIIGSA